VVGERDERDACHKQQERHPEGLGGLAGVDGGVEAAAGDVEVAHLVADERPLKTANMAAATIAARVATPRIRHTPVMSSSQGSVNAAHEASTYGRIR